MSNRGFIADDDHSREGCAHARKLRVFLAGIAQNVVCLPDCLFENLASLFGVFVDRVSQGYALGNQGRGDVATCVTTHAIGNEEQVETGIARVLVARTHAPDIGGRIADGFDCHFLASFEARKRSCQLELGCST